MNKIEEKRFVLHQYCSIGFLKKLRRQTAEMNRQRAGNSRQSRVTKSDQNEESKNKSQNGLLRRRYVTYLDVCSPSSPVSHTSNTQSACKELSENMATSFADETFQDVPVDESFTGPY
jgi:hypothetical protein